MTTCARCGRCSRRRRGRFSGRSIGPGRSASSTSGAQRGDPVGHGQTRRGLGRRRVPGLLARGRRRAGLFQGDRGPALGHRALPVVVGRPAADAGLGPPGRPARPRRAPDGGVRRLLRPAARRLAFLRAGRPAGQGRHRAPAGLPGAQLRTRPALRQPARLPAQLDAWFDKRANARPHKTLGCRPIDRLARGAPGDGPAARARARHRSALGAPRPARPAPAL